MLAQPQREAPSDEQRVVVEHVAGGQCVIVTAVPGAGKTTLALHIARAIRRRGESMVLLTYNRAVSNDVKERINREGLVNVKAYTIHAFLADQAGQECRDTQQLAEITLGLDNGSIQPRPAAWHVLHLDEAQDVSKPMSYALRALLRAAPPQLGARMVISCDAYQTLYDWPALGGEGAYPCAMQRPHALYGQAFAHPLHCRPWPTFKLSTSYRLGHPVAALANAYWGRGDCEIVPGNAAATLPVVAHNVESYSDKIVGIVLHLVEKYGVDNVAVLAQSAYRSPGKSGSSPLGALSNKLAPLVPTHVREQGNRTTNVQRGKLLMSTFCQAKGIERDCVVILGFEVYDVNKIMDVNQVCVGITRAQQELHIILGSSPVYPLRGALSEFQQIDRTCRTLDALVRQGMVLVEASPLIRRANANQGNDVISVSPSNVRVGSVAIQAFIHAVVRDDASMIVPVEGSAPDRRMYTRHGSDGIVYDISAEIGRAIPLIHRLCTQQDVDHIELSSGERERPVEYAANLAFANNAKHDPLFVLWVSIVSGRDGFDRNKQRYIYRDMRGRCDPSYKWHFGGILEKASRVIEHALGAESGTYEMPVKHGGFAGIADFISDKGTVFEFKYRLGDSAEDVLQLALYGAMVAQEQKRDVRCQLANAALATARTFVVRHGRATARALEELFNVCCARETDRDRHLRRHGTEEGESAVSEPAEPGFFAQAYTDCQSPPSPAAPTSPEKPTAPLPDCAAGEALILEGCVFVMVGDFSRTRDEIKKAIRTRRWFR
jgi:predicted ATPase